MMLGCMYCGKTFQEQPADGCCGEVHFDELTEIDFLGLAKMIFEDAYVNDVARTVDILDVFEDTNKVYSLYYHTIWHCLGAGVSYDCENGQALYRGSEPALAIRAIINEMRNSSSILEREGADVFEAKLDSIEESYIIKEVK